MTDAMLFGGSEPTEADCLCGSSGADEFGNHERLEHPDCPIHAPAPEVALTPTESLVLEVLAARHRLGEHLWTFTDRPAITRAINKLVGRGLVGSKGGVVDHTVRAWLTEDGRAAAMSDDYVPPILREAA